MYYSHLFSLLPSVPTSVFLLVLFKLLLLLHHCKGRCSHKIVPSFVSVQTLHYVTIVPIKAPCMEWLFRRAYLFKCIGTKELGTPADVISPTEGRKDSSRSSSGSFKYFYVKWSFLFSSLNRTFLSFQFVFFTSHSSKKTGRIFIVQILTTQGRYHSTR